MSTLVLALALLAPQASNSTVPVEGVWIDQSGQSLFIGNRRVDWKRADVYCSAMLDGVPDGSFLGTYVAGRDLFVGLEPGSTAESAVDWLSNWQRDAPRKGEASTETPHLGPDPRTYVKPYGEARVSVVAVGGSGVPMTIALGTRSTSPTPDVVRYNRAMSMDDLGIAGKYGDKEATVGFEDSSGRTSVVRGALTYLGKRYDLAGRRIMGRTGFVLFDPSRLGPAGEGYAVWAPTPARAIDIRNRESSRTDVVDLYFSVSGTRMHKTLKLLG